jgi:hypothetical protein
MGHRQAHPRTEQLGAAVPRVVIQSILRIEGARTGYRLDPLLLHSLKSCLLHAQTEKPLRRIGD